LKGKERKEGRNKENPLFGRAMRKKRKVIGGIIKPPVCSTFSCPNPTKIWPIWAEMKGF
jgi:hypothetical protein